jgi:putative hydrolase of the HAD superfamily
MAHSVQGIFGIQAILFDMNGTLRVREPDDATQKAACTRIAQLLHRDCLSQSFVELLKERYQEYGKWAQANLIQLSEAEVWTKWLLPDQDPAGVAPVAAELTLAWSRRNGKPVSVPGAWETLSALKRRGYHLGVISNSLSSLDIPQSLESFGWEDLFDIVVLSSMLKRRKPDPEVFLHAASRLGIEPQRCAYVGNRFSKDVPGCLQAGFSQALIVRVEGSSATEEFEGIPYEYAVVHSLNELLEKFSSPGVAVDLE